MLTFVVHDLRHGLRMLRARPGFTLAVVLSLALGIGGNTAVFSVIEGRLLRPLPYPDSERLVAIYNSYPLRGDTVAGNTVPDYLDRRQQATALADSALYYDYSFDLTDGGPPLRVPGVVATPSLFGLLGVTPQIGRSFTDQEAEPLHDVDAVWAGGSRVVLLGDALWRQRFAADPGIVGRDIRISGHPHRVIGVMPATFAFPRREVQLWLPFAFSERQKADAMRGFEFAHSIGRLKPEATIEQLNAQFDAITARTLQRLSAADSAETAFAARVQGSGFSGRAQSLQTLTRGDIGATLWLLQAAAALVLLIACANVANLMLIRWHARRRELGLRVVLGAVRGRIAQQLLVESGLLAAGGGVLGIALAAGGVAMIRAAGLDGTETGMGIGLRLPVLGFALAATAACVLLTGLLPLLLLRTAQPAASLNDAARGIVGSRAGRRQRSLLVVAQVALAVALLVGSGLLAHSYWRLQQIDPGFNADHLVTANLNLSRDRYRNVDDTARFHQRLGAAVRAMPGVSAAGVISGLPFSADDDSGPYRIEGDDRDGDRGPAIAHLRTVDSDYFATMQIPLLQGRGFNAADRADSTPVVIIDQQLARQSFGERNPLGERLGTPGVDGRQHWHTIVGVVASVKQTSLAEPDAMPTYYTALLQQPPRIARLVIRSELPGAVLATQLRERLATIDAEQPLWGITSMRQRIDDSLGDRRSPMLLLILFATVALALGTLGVYSTLAYSVALRSGEIGVRMSLGAARTDILRAVLREGCGLLAAGLLLGGGLAIAVARQVRASLFGVDPLDPLSLAAVLLLVAGVGLLACWIPARRAANISPMEALRYE